MSEQRKARTEIDGAMKHGRLRRRAGALLAVLLTAGLAGAFLTVLASTRPAPLSLEPTSTPRPSPTPATLSPSREPTTTPAPTPIVTPTAEPRTDPEVGELVFSITYGNVGGVFTSSLVEDGRLTFADIYDLGTYVQRRLSPSGVELVRREIVATGLFEESAEYPLVGLPGVEPPGMGLAGYHMRYANDRELIDVSWISGFHDGVWFEISPERQALDELAERLSSLWDWLPDSAWIDITPRVYQAERLRLFTIVVEYGGPVASLPPEVATVQWPLGDSLLTFGEARWDEHPTLRCAVISADEAQLVAAALADAGAPFPGPVLIAGFSIRADLGLREEPASVGVILEALRPEETECAEEPTQGW